MLRKIKVQRLRKRIFKLGLVLGTTAMVCVTCRCTGVGFTLKSLVRSGRDYEALELERAKRTVVSEPPMTSQALPAYWTQYRGPKSDGIYDESPLQLDGWDAAPPILWSAPVGPAYSSVVVASGLVITMEQQRDQEAVIAFDLASGTLVWEHAWPDRFYHVLSKEGPRATPAIDGEFVVALGADGELRCLDLQTGTMHWRQDLLEGSDNDNLDFGLSASPRVRNETVYVQGASEVCALDLRSGELLWTALAETMAYSTPQFGELLGSTYLMVCAKERIIGLDLNTGTELWTFPWKYLGDTCTQPMALTPNRVLISSGYGKGSQLVELKQTPHGITANVVWKSSRFKTRYNEPVLDGDRLYGLDEGTLTCIDVQTGKRLWKQGRYGYGQLLLHRDTLLVVGEDGEVHSLRISAEGPEEVANFTGVDGGMTLNLPALAHGRLFVRNEEVLVVFDLRGRGEPMSDGD